MSSVEKVSIALSSDLLRSVRRAVASGEYASSSEVVREALREWRARRPALVPASGQAPREVLADRRTQLHALCEQFGVQRLGLFGSALREDFDPARSDLDVTVEFGAETALSALEFFAFKAALEALFGRTVDLVELATMPGSRLKRLIERTRQIIYDRDAPA